MWRKNSHHYGCRVMWRCRLVKGRISLLFSGAGVERCRKREIMEHFYNRAMHELLQNEGDIGDETLALESLEAKIID